MRNAQLWHLFHSPLSASLMTHSVKNISENHSQSVSIKEAIHY